ncbi:MAG: hypothetical protein MUF15_27465, partial [Acidobacteria bacterium]|nr:hypothetical protein [Acidobacteriota bacterium]
MSIEETNPNYFRVDLDVYSSNSGSPVFCAETHELLGIVSRGKAADFRWTEEGWMTLRYPKTDPAYKSSQCTRVSNFKILDHYPQKKWEHQFKYKIKIEPSEKDFFHITWDTLKENTFHSFENSVSDITQKEMTNKDLFPPNRRLKLLFMASCPLDVQPEPHYEIEEEGIFKVGKELPFDMDVEDTGSLVGIRKKLEQQHYDIVHLSGYTVVKNGQPFFVMENEKGYRKDISVEKLWQDGLQVNPPRLLFISGINIDGVPSETEKIARILVEKYHVSAVFIWEQIKSENETNEIAVMVYMELSRGKNLRDVVQRVENQLNKCYSSSEKLALPKLRLFGSVDALDAAIVVKNQKPLPQLWQINHAQLGNKGIKLLTKGFVGRRRQLQQSIRILKSDREKKGLLILGTGKLGKSCLAGKVSERLKEHTLISLHGKFNSISLKQALKDAFVISQDEHGKKVLTWEIEMKDIIGVLCRTCFEDRRYLILLDDFEQNLEGWSEGKPGDLLPEAAELLKALLDNLPDSEKMTQMIITSRYDFSIVEKDFDLV